MINKPLISYGIPLVSRVLTAVNLDDEPPFAANEIHNVGSDWLLPNKFKAKQRA
jgi:hypothetical protein